MVHCTPQTLTKILEEASFMNNKKKWFYGFGNFNVTNNNIIRQSHSLDWFSFFVRLLVSSTIGLIFSLVFTLEFNRHIGNDATFVILLNEKRETSFISIYLT